MTRPRVLTLLRHLDETLGASPFQRTLLSAYLFDFIDRQAANGFPVDWVSRLTDETERFVAVSHCFDVPPGGGALVPDAGPPPGDAAEVARRTGDVYARLWTGFSGHEYYRQAADYLSTRLARNGCSVAEVQNALDAGCGGGRYTLALRALGCARVTGLDISADAIAFATRMSAFPTEEVEFRAGSVLALPFEDEAFDFVFSNGVLHHTTDIHQGLMELRRVLAPGGRAWLYLYGGPESFFWDVVEACRALLRGIPQAYVQEVMRLMGYSAGRIFHRVDFWFAPIQNRYTAHETESMLQRAGFERFRRMRRGAPHDWDELMHVHPGLDPYFFGGGEMRYWIEG